MTTKLLLHVGTPKTGTSYLQEVLFHNRHLLADHKILYPVDRFDSHFLAALDLMRMPWGGIETEAVGAWELLAERIRGYRGTVIVSHEIFAAASTTEIARGLASLGDDIELHLVLSVRDLVRQIPAEWQENVKHRASIGFGAFLDELRKPERDHRIASWFWAVQEVPDIINRWGAGLPPERIHLITVPPSGADPDLLWQRFVTAFGLEGLELELPGLRANPSLGVPETALVRRINQAVTDTIDPASYRPLVREFLVHQHLATRTGSPRLALPPDHHAWAAALGQTWIEQLRAAEYDVVGDLNDLVGPPAVEDYANPDQPRERQVADAAVAAISALLHEHVRLTQRQTQLEAEIDHLRHGTRWTRQRVQRAVVRRLKKTRWGRGVVHQVKRLARRG